MYYWNTRGAINLHGFANLFSRSQLFSVVVLVTLFALLLLKRGPLGTAASSTCDLEVEGGNWCNINQINCESGCIGKWCTNDGGGPVPPSSPPPPPANCPADSNSCGPNSPCADGSCCSQWGVSDFPCDTRRRVPTQLG